MKKVKKVDYLSIVLSIVINLVILFFIPGLNVETVVNKKIKVGLVVFDNNKKIKIDSKANTNSPKKAQPKVEETQEPKKTEKKEEKKQNNDAVLDKLAGSIKMPDVGVLSTPTGNRTSKNPGDDIKPKKELKEGIEAPKDTREVKTQEQQMDIDTNKGPKEKDEKFTSETDDKIAYNSEEGTDITFDRILNAEDGVVGLPSGYRLGTEDGEVVARWENSNKEPKYPEKAQLRGMHGTVKIRMSIDENGNVLSLRLEKGSGVPEINEAIEEVGRTWKVYLSRNGLNVKGDVILEYNFTLKGHN